ncbi:hypothetical protein TI39_contig5647g00001 [Zymoseptoria brevis]|uniref:C2H2-type domain-containing protein n=1 Tax=Zymoseptoria brevis TaxID=1047168 RepID=A0A0F4G6B3_9PEZI|nr:hypothetical protein TI39_contig5647g00001 [Zymoseptoria brevis]
MLSEHICPVDPSLPLLDHILTDNHKFMTALSAYNVSSCSNLANLGRSTQAFKDLKATYEGGSRDPVTQFEVPCKNQIFGCPWTFPRFQRRKEHEANCAITSRELGDAVAAKEAEREANLTFPCVKDPANCTRVFASPTELTRHHFSQHSWPKPCKEPGCEGVMLTSEWDRHKHISSTHHAAYTPTACRFPSCKSTNLFATAAALYKHYKTAHNKGRDEANILLRPINSL